MNKSIRKRMPRQDRHSFVPMNLKGKSIKELKQEIIKAIRDISSDPAMISEFQAFIRQFHNYSFWNLILIWMQCPAATQVAGYRTWQKLGRYVKQGERAIYILAPLLKKIEEPDKDTGEMQTAKILKGFKPVSVFAYEQTDGKALVVPPIGKLKTENPETVYASLRQLAQREGLKVIETNMPFVQGGATNGNIVWVNSLNPVEGRCMTMLHEVAHVLLDHAGARKEIHRSKMEVEAELTAFLAALGLGIPRGCFEYINSWGALDDESVEYALKAAEKIISRQR